MEGNSINGPDHSQFMVEAGAAGNLVVVRTQPGNATPVAFAGHDWMEELSTVAGDDTILVVTADAAPHD
jgi:arginine repressor